MVLFGHLELLIFIWRTTNLEVIFESFITLKEKGGYFQFNYS